MTVEGKIVATHNSGKACFLNFHTNWREHFTAVIFASSFHKFPSQPERYYDGKIVRVTGTIKEYKGKPQIIVKDQSQIKIKQKSKRVTGGIKGYKGKPEIKTIQKSKVEVKQEISQGVSYEEFTRTYENLNEEGKKLLEGYLKFLSDMTVYSK